MSDFYFNKFYKDIKDVSWPNAENITEFCQLPEKIQNECIEQHGLNDRMIEIQSTAYWRNKSYQSTVWCMGTLVYVPVMKCAHTYYTDVFKQQGWIPKNIWDLDLTTLHAFGLIMHPLTRRLKGITQSLIVSFDHDPTQVIALLQQKNVAEFVQSIAITDGHTMPYSVTYDTKLSQIHWIPMDCLSDNAIKQEITTFCKTHGVEVHIPKTNVRSNASSAAKLQLYQLLKNQFLQQDSVPPDLYQLFADDISFYHNLIKQRS